MDAFIAPQTYEADAPQGAVVPASSLDNASYWESISNEAVVPPVASVSESWQLKNPTEWTVEEAEAARVAEWAKLKGPTVSLVTDDQLGEEAPAVTKDSTFAIYTGHGYFNFEVNGIQASSTFEYKEGRLNVFVVTNKTERPFQVHGTNFPTGGTSLAEYRSGQFPDLDAIAVYPTIDRENHHCGVDCVETIVQHFVAVYDEETQETKVYGVRYRYFYNDEGRLTMEVIDSEAK